MKKKLLIALSALMLMSIVFASGCTQKYKSLAADDLYKKIPKAEHEKRFPRGHDDENIRCYYDKETGAHFCQYWDIWDD